MDEIRPEYDVAGGVSGDFGEDFDETIPPGSEDLPPNAFLIAN